MRLSAGDLSIIVARVYGSRHKLWPEVATSYQVEWPCAYTLYPTSSTQSQLALLAPLPSPPIASMRVTKWSGESGRNKGKRDDEDENGSWASCNSGSES